MFFRDEAALAEEAADSDHVTVPFCPTDGARLHVVGGASRLHVHSSSRSSYRANVPLASVLFEGGAGEVDASGGDVTIDCGTGFWTAFGFGMRSLDVSLSSEVPWSIDVRGGVAHGDLDLAGIDLDGLLIRGGIHRVRMRLPRPLGTVRIEIRGGIHDCEIVRPRGVPMAFDLRGGAAHLELDQLHLGAVSKLAWATPDFAEAADRYVIEVRGGTSRLSTSMTKRDHATAHEQVMREAIA